MIGILIVDDQSLIRAGFSALLDAEDDMRVLGQASNGVQALAQARALKPDIVLMDIRMPQGDGITAADSHLLGPRPGAHPDHHAHHIRA